MARQKNTRQWNRNQIIFAVIALIIIFTFTISLIVTDNATHTTQTQSNNADNNPFPTPTPTLISVPTVEPDGIQIGDGEPLVNVSGYFQMFQPDDAPGLWTVQSNEFDADQNTANLILISPERLAVIHGIARARDLNVTSLEVLQNVTYDISFFDRVWASYQVWTITDQRIIGDSLLVYDFELEGVVPNDIAYIARQVTWLEPKFINTLRIVVPANNPELLDILYEKSLQSFITYPDSPQTGIAGIEAKSHPDIGLMIMLPSYWEILDGGPGRLRTTYHEPFPIEGEDYQITVQRRENTALDSLDAAQAWLEQVYSTISIIEGRVVNQRFAEGYVFGYTFQNVDGDSFSAAMMLLNDSAGNLFTAEVRTNQPAINFLGSVLTFNQQRVFDFLQSFTVLAPSGYQNIPQPFSAEAKTVPQSTPQATP